VSFFFSPDKQQPWCQYLVYERHSEQLINAWSSVCSFPGIENIRLPVWSPRQRGWRQNAGTTCRRRDSEPSATAETSAASQPALKDQTGKTQTQKKLQIPPGTGTSMNLCSKCQLLEVSRTWLKIDMQVSSFTCQKGSPRQIRSPSPSFHPIGELSTICNCKSWLQCRHRVQISMHPFNYIQILRSPGFHRMCAMWRCT